MFDLNNSLRLNGFAAEKVTTRKVGSTDVTQFSVATTMSRKNKNTGEYEDYTEWHTVEAWGRTAQYVAKNLRKGSQVTLEGKVEYSNYEKEHVDGKNKVTVKHSRMIVRANTVQIRNRKRSDEEE